MTPLRRRISQTLAATLLALSSAAAQAVIIPIVYQGTLVKDGAAMAGLLPIGSSFNDPRNAAWFQFTATAGEGVSILATPTESGFDVGFWALLGSFADTSAFGATTGSNDGTFTSQPFCSTINPRDPTNCTRLGLGDNDVHPSGLDQFDFVAPVTGSYSIGIISAGPGSGGGACPDGDDNNLCPFNIELNSYSPPPPVPVPAAVWLLGSGLLGVIGVARRRADSAKAR